MNVILLIIFIINVAYLIIISYFTIGWFKLKYFQTSDKILSTKISIIIPARDEENNIENILNDIINQDYQTDLFEVIVVNDESKDKTKILIENFISRNIYYKIKLIDLNNISVNSNPENYFGKKRALAEGINASAGDLIITTDADCRIGKKWLSTIAEFYEERKPKMIICPVSFQKENNLFKKLQSLEFLSLIGTTAGSAAINKPIMCNGANLAFEKKAFNESDGYNGNSAFPGGDDMFLMEKINKIHNNKIEFLKNKNAIAYTEAKNNLSDLISQRKRWVSKTKGYKSFRIIFVAVIVFLFNLSLIFLLIDGIFIPKLLLIFAYLIIIKSIIDFPIISGMAGFMNKKHLLKYFVPLQLVYPIYVSYLGIIGNFSSYFWKGREIKI
jgi:cellulose synthase/poly-beta-1,6-N-acetylglucosamine synthase-like glycosyltransferase